MNQQPPGVDELWIQHQRRNAKTTQSWACIHCPDRHIFVNCDELWAHALREHYDHIPSDEGDQRRYRSKFEAESAEKKRTTKDDYQPRKPNFNEAINTQPELPLVLGPHGKRPWKRPLPSPYSTRSLSSLGGSNTGTPSGGETIAQPRRRPAIGDGISAGSASPSRDASASPSPRRSRAIPTSAPAQFASETDKQQPNSFEIQRPNGKKQLWSPDHDVPVSKTIFDPANIGSVQAQKSRAQTFQAKSQNAKSFQPPQPMSSRSPLPQISQPAQDNRGPSTIGRISAPRDSQADPRDKNFDIMLQPETRPISQEQLVAEVKGIYSGLVMVEAKCIEVDNKQAALAQVDAGASPQLDNEGNKAVHGEKKPQSFFRRTYSKVAGYKRKALRIFFNGHDTFARPDTASDQDIMTEAFANEQDIAIQRDATDQSLFLLGAGNYVKSVGKARVPISLFGSDIKEEFRWFHVLRKCPVPLILGMKFVEKIKLYTRNKHLLVDCPFNFGSLPTLKWIGSPRGFVKFRANGKQLVGCADTGSDLDFMSLRCAKRLGFKIDGKPSARSRVMLADESIVETVGQVHISSVELSYFDSFEMSFHVLPGLASDVIFSEDFLDQMDAFNTCAQIKDTEDPYQRQINTLISLGPIQAFLSRTWTPDVADTAQQEHDQIIEAEIYRRNNIKRSIRKMRDEDKVAAARASEQTKKRIFDQSHARCTHCIGSNRGTATQSL